MEMNDELQGGEGFDDSFDNVAQSMQCMVVSNDEQHLLCGDNRGNLLLWEMGNDRKINLPRSQWNGHDGGVSAMCWSDSKRLFASAGTDGIIALWKVFQGDHSILRRFKGHHGAITSLNMFSIRYQTATGDQDDDSAGETGAQTLRMLFSTSRDGSLRVWDTETGSSRSVIKANTGGSILCLAISPCQRYFVTGDDSGTAQMWEFSPRSYLPPEYRPSGYSRLVEHISDCLHELIGHGGSVTSVAWSKDSHIVWTGSSDGFVRMWDALTTDCMRVFPLQNSNHIQELAAAGMDGAGSVVAAQELPPMAHIALGDEDTVLVVASTQGYHLSVWNLASARMVSTIAAPLFPSLSEETNHGSQYFERDEDDGEPMETRPVVLTALAPNKAFLYTVYEGDSDVWLWDVYTGQLMGRFSTSRENVAPFVDGSSSRAVSCVDVSPDGLFLAVGNEDGSVFCWHLDFSTDRKGPSSSSSSSLRRSVVMGSPYLPQNGAATGPIASIHIVSVRQLSNAIAPSSDLLAPADTGTTAVRPQVALPRRANHSIPSGWEVLVVSSGQDGSVRLWNMADGRCLQTVSTWDAAIVKSTLSVIPRVAEDDGEEDEDEDDRAHAPVTFQMVLWTEDQSLRWIQCVLHRSQLDARGSVPPISTSWTHNLSDHQRHHHHHHHPHQQHHHQSDEIVNIAANRLGSSLLVHRRRMAKAATPESVVHVWYFPKTCVSDALRQVAVHYTQFTTPGIYLQHTAIAPNGMALVGVSASGLLHVWSLSTQQCVLRTRITVPDDGAWIDSNDAEAIPIADGGAATTTTSSSMSQKPTGRSTTSSVRVNTNSNNSNNSSNRNSNSSKANGATASSKVSLKMLKSSKAAQNQSRWIRGPMTGAAAGGGAGAGASIGAGGHGATDRNVEGDDRAEKILETTSLSVVWSSSMATDLGNKGVAAAAAFALDAILIGTSLGVVRVMDQPLLDLGVHDDSAAGAATDATLLQSTSTLAIVDALQWTLEEGEDRGHCNWHRYRTTVAETARAAMAATGDALDTSLKYGLLSHPTVGRHVLKQVLALHANDATQYRALVLLGHLVRSAPTLLLPQGDDDSLLAHALRYPYAPAAVRVILATYLQLLEDAYDPYVHHVDHALLKRRILRRQRKQRQLLERQHQQLHPPHGHSQQNLSFARTRPTTATATAPALGHHPLPHRRKNVRFDGDAAQGDGTDAFSSCDSLHELIETKEERHSAMDASHHPLHVRPCEHVKLPVHPPQAPPVPPSASAPSIGGIPLLAHGASHGAKMPVQYLPYQGEAARTGLQQSHRAVHVADHIRIEDLDQMGKKYPELMLWFAQQLSLCRQYRCMMTPETQRLPLEQSTLVVGSMYRCKPGFWSLRRVLRHASMDVEDEVAMAMVPYLVPIRNIVGKSSRFLDVLIESAEKLDNLTVFDHEVVQTVVQFKWTTLIRFLFYRDFVLIFLYMVVYLTQVIVYASLVQKIEQSLPQAQYQTTQLSWIVTVLLTVLCLVYFLGRSCVQMRIVWLHHIAIFERERRNLTRHSHGHGSPPPPSPPSELAKRVQATVSTKSSWAAASSSSSAQQPSTRSSWKHLFSSSRSSALSDPKSRGHRVYSSSSEGDDLLSAAAAAAAAVDGAAPSDGNDGGRGADDRRGATARSAQETLRSSYIYVSLASRRTSASASVDTRSMSASSMAPPPSTAASSKASNAPASVRRRRWWRRWKDNTWYVGVHALFNSYLSSGWNVLHLVTNCLVIITLCFEAVTVFGATDAASRAGYIVTVNSYQPTLVPSFPPSAWPTYQPSVASVTWAPTVAVGGSGGGGSITTAAPTVPFQAPTFITFPPSNAGGAPSPMAPVATPTAPLSVSSPLSQPSSTPSLAIAQLVASTFAPSVPTLDPTTATTSLPSPAPSAAPTAHVTNAAPTKTPTAIPSPAGSPSPLPTPLPPPPTPHPTCIPTRIPTRIPTANPTMTGTSPPTMGMTRQPTVLGTPATATPTVAVPAPVTPAAVASSVLHTAAAVATNDDELVSFAARDASVWLQAGSSAAPTASGSRAPTQQRSSQPTVKGSSAVRAPVDQGYPLNLDRSAMLTASVVMPFFACEILFYLGGLPWTAPLVRMLIKITEGTMTFLAVLLLMIVTFAGSFVVLFINLKSKSDDESTQATETATIAQYSHFEMALSTVFCFLFGQFDTDDFTLSRSASLATLMLFMFLFFVVIIMLNLLIAMMGDKYDEVQERATAEAMYAKAKLVWEYDAMLRYFYGDGAAERRQRLQRQGPGQRPSHDELLREARLAEDEEDDADGGCGGFAPGSWIRDYLLPTDSLFPCATTALRWWRRRRAARHRAASTLHRRRHGDAAALHSLDLDEDTDEDADADEATARAAAADGSTASAASSPLLPHWQRRYYPEWIQILKKEALDVTYDPAADHDSDSDGDGRFGRPGGLAAASSSFGAMDTSSTSGSDSASDDADESGPSKPSLRRKPSSLSSFLAGGAFARTAPSSGGVEGHYRRHRTTSHAAGPHRASMAMPTMTATAASMNPAAAAFGAPAQRWSGRMSAFKNSLQRETMVWQFMLQQQLAQQEQHVASLVAQQAQYLQALHQETSARVEEQLHEQRQLLHRLVTVAAQQAQPPQSASSSYAHSHHPHPHAAPASFDESVDH
eukprot:gene3977-2831_t